MDTIGMLGFSDVMLENTKLTFSTVEKDVGTLDLKTGIFEGDAEESSKVFWYFVEKNYGNTIFNKIKILEEENKKLNDELNKLIIHRR